MDNSSEESQGLQEENKTGRKKNLNNNDKHLNFIIIFFTPKKEI